MRLLKLNNKNDKNIISVSFIPPESWAAEILYEHIILLLIIQYQPFDPERLGNYLDGWNCIGFHKRKILIVKILRRL